MTGKADFTDEEWTRLKRGPFVAGSAALGVLSGGTGDCTTPGGSSLYQPIDEVLRVEGLTLATAS